MRTVKEIYEAVKIIAPETMAYEWDHIGLLCGHFDREVTRVLVALDPFLPVCMEAKKLGCQLLLTHHPAIWDLKAVNDATPAGRVLLYLAENGIAAINAHTNLDCAPGGVNDCLAAALGLQNTHIIDPRESDGRSYGLLRGGTVAQTDAKTLAAHVKRCLHCAGLRYVDGGKPITRVAVGGGACGEELFRVAALGYDAFITADIKYNGFFDAQSLGVTLIDAGHFQTENPVCAYLADTVRTRFPELEIFLSKTHRDCIIFA